MGGSVNQPFVHCIETASRHLVGRECSIMATKLLARAVPDGSRRSPRWSRKPYCALKRRSATTFSAPGYQGSEQEIAVRLGMSRTPVHEAIIRLQEDGLVRVLSKRGVLVCPLAPEDVREIYDVIIAIESMAAELLAALPASERQSVANELEAATVRMEAGSARQRSACLGSRRRCVPSTLVTRCGNSRLRRIAQTVTDQAHRARMLTLKLRSRPEGSATAHRRIIAAIRNGTCDEAHFCARQHRVAARDELVPLIVSVGMRHL